jgi:hypothetical protein
MSTTPSVFVSYSHEDEDWKGLLLNQLEALESEGLLAVWDDRRIGAGDDWENEIATALSQARVAVLLVSAHFLRSRFIRGKEIPRLLRRRKEEGLRIFPVIVEPCLWQHTWLGKIQVRPVDGRPLSGGSEHQIQTDLVNIAEEMLAFLGEPEAAERQSLAPDHVSVSAEPDGIEPLTGRSTSQLQPNVVGGQEGAPRESHGPEAQGGAQGNAIPSRIIVPRTGVAPPASSSAHRPALRSTLSAYAIWVGAAVAIIMAALMGYARLSRGPGPPSVRAQVTVVPRPDTVGIAPGGYSEVRYQFTERAGAEVGFFEQNTQFFASSGKALGEPCNGCRLLGGEFRIAASGSHTLADNVYLPEGVAAEAEALGATFVNLKTTFVGRDSGRNTIEVRAVVKVVAYRR